MCLHLSKAVGCLLPAADVCLLIYWTGLQCSCVFVCELMSLFSVVLRGYSCAEISLQAAQKLNTFTWEFGRLHGFLWAHKGGHTKSMYRARFPASSHRYYTNTRVIYTHRYIWTVYCCQTNKGPARWQPMLTLPSKDSGSSQRVATASSVGVRSLAQQSCGTLYRRQPRSGRARKPSSYWGMTSSPVRTLLRAHTGQATVDSTALFPSASRISTLGTAGPPTL